MFIAQGCSLEHKLGIGKVLVQSLASPVKRLWSGISKIVTWWDPEEPLTLIQPLQLTIFITFATMTNLQGRTAISPSYRWKMINYRWLSLLTVWATYTVLLREVLGHNAQLLSGQLGSGRCQSVQLKYKPHLPFNEQKFHLFVVANEMPKAISQIPGIA